MPEGQEEQITLSGLRDRINEWEARYEEAMEPFAGTTQDLIEYDSVRFDWMLDFYSVVTTFLSKPDENEEGSELPPRVPPIWENFRVGDKFRIRDPLTPGSRFVAEAIEIRRKANVVVLELSYPEDHTRANCRETWDLRHVRDGLKQQCYVEVKGLSNA